MGKDATSLARALIEVVPSSSELADLAAAGAPRHDQEGSRSLIGSIVSAVGKVENLDACQHRWPGGRRESTP